MEIKTTTKKMSSGFDNFINGIANDLRNELVTTCPVDIGDLKRSIRVKPSSTGYNIMMVKHGLYVEYGTPPHIIRPKNKKALAFAKFGGQRVIRGGDVKTKMSFGGKSVITDAVFAKVVHHPGTRPQPFIRTTINTKLREVIKNNVLRHLV